MIYFHPSRVVPKMSSLVGFALLVETFAECLFVILGLVCVRYVCLSALNIHKSCMYMHNHSIKIFMTHFFAIYLCLLSPAIGEMFFPKQMFVFDLSI
jgi:hypothetical protein